MLFISMKGIIYKIICDDESFYIGKTNRPLSQRIYNHKRDYNDIIKYGNTKLYKHIRLNGGWDYCEIIILEELEITNEELRKKEDKYIRDNLSNSKFLNTKKAIRSEDEKNDYGRNKMASYREPNKEVINCNCGIKTTKGRLEQHINSVKHKKQMKII